MIKLRQLFEVLDFKERAGMSVNEAQDFYSGHSIPALKKMATNSSEHEARFTVDHKGRMNVGDGFNYTHYELGGEDAHTHGMVHYHPHSGKHSYIAWNNQDSKDEPHVITKKFEKHGIEKWNKDNPDHDYPDINEIQKRTVMSYINKAQDRPDRMWKNPDSKLKSFITAQKKIGQSKERPRVMAEGKTQHIDGDFGTGRVYTNPTREQAKNINDRSYRSYHDSKNLHLWGMSTGLIHSDVQKHMGLEDTNNRAFFHHKDLAKNNFDAHKTHEEFRVRKGVPKKTANMFGVKSGILSTGDGDAESYYDHYHDHGTNENYKNIKLRQLFEAKLMGDYTVHHNKEFDGSNRYEVRHKGKKAGFATLDTANKTMDYVMLDKEHQGKGVGTALHKHIEKHIGHPLDKAKEYTEAGKKFWNKYNSSRVNEIEKRTVINYIDMTENLYDGPSIHMNKGIGTLKHLAKTGPSKTMKFYISSSSPDANMYSGDSAYYTHHQLGARASQIQGAITHHPDSDTYHYQAWHSRDGKNVETTHPRLANMEKLGVTRGHWNSDEARVEKPIKEVIIYSKPILKLKGAPRLNNSRTVINMHPKTKNNDNNTETDNNVKGDLE